MERPPSHKTDLIDEIYLCPLCGNVPDTVAIRNFAVFMYEYFFMSLPWSLIMKHCDLVQICTVVCTGPTFF